MSSRTVSVPLSISHEPAHGQLICHLDKEYETIKEGQAYILVPKPQVESKPVSKSPTTSTTSTTETDLNPLPASSEPPKKEREARVAKNSGATGTPGGQTSQQQVFYNPIQQFNRDLSILAIRAFGEETVKAKARFWEERRRLLDEKRNSKGKKRKRDEHEEEQTVGSVYKQASGDEHCTATQESNGKDDAATVESTDTISGNGPRPKEAQQDEERSTPQKSDGDINGHPSSASFAPGDVENPGVSADKKNRVSFTILDALSATGLRALRYARELPFVTSVLANDVSSDATKAIGLNAEHNRISPKVVAHTGDAGALMYAIACSHHVEVPPRSKNYYSKFDVIDLDPYGTAAPFLDAAVQAVKDGGLLCVTCTDAGVFASSGYPEKTYSLYGGLPLKGPQSHEAGLRLIVNAIATSAARYSYAIEPLLSLSIDFYARIFVRVHHSAAQTKFLAGKTMIVYSCDAGCGAWTTQLLGRNRECNGKNDTKYWKHSHSQGPNTGPHCQHCGTKMHIAGPMWAGPLHSPNFIQSILDVLPSLNRETYQTIPRIEGMLTVAMEEDLSLQERKTRQSALDATDPTLESSLPETSPNHAAKSEPYPFFIIPNTLCKVIHAQTPDEDSLRGALRSLGYRVSRSHTKPGSIKTDAPWSVLWEVIREWARQKSPLRADSITEGSAGWTILARGRQMAGQDSLSTMKSKLIAAIEKAADIESLKTEVEAAMYRSSRELDGLSNKAESDDGEEDGKKILIIPPSKLKVVFDKELGAEKRGKKIVRYQMNPRSDWGPMHRAKGGGGRKLT